MSARVDKFRLSLASMLAHTAAHVSPKSMRPAFMLYVGLLASMGDEQKRGRTWGCALAPWFLGRDEDYMHALSLQHIAGQSMHAERRRIEAEIAANEKEET